jgi:MoaA/NifB/PqqE/SkfB family radical SAM enzyme
LANILTEIVLMDQMPLTFNALVVEYTTRCTARCAMCYQAAGPKGSDILDAARLPEDIIRRLIREARSIDSLEPRFHITGGEAFIDEDMLLRLVAFAREEGFSTLTTTTNAFWAARPERALDLCRRARQAGLTGMEISWDHWHRPYVDAQAVSNCLDACAATGIDANLRILSTKSHSYAEALRLLRPESLARAGSVTCAPVHSTGRASKELDLDEVYRQGTLDDTCHSVLNLTVNARGDVSPCCAGLDQLASYRFGNVRESHLRDIADRLNRSPIVRMLVFRGVRHLLAAMKEAGVDIDGDHRSICHLCWSIFSEPRHVAALEAAMRERRRNALQAAIARLQAAAVSVPA